MSPLRQWIGSALFTAAMYVSIPLYALLVFATAFNAPRTRFFGVGLWVDTMLWLLARLCRLDYVVEGREHLPEENAVVLMKHSSAWETIAQLKFFPFQTWVLKRELMWAPFFGWALWLLGAIAIDRRGGGAAVRQVIEQGTKRLEEGRWVVIFPEGTRVPYGQTRRYGLSGALLASAAGRPIVPVAHNAGLFWPRRGFIKRPGTIRVVIGPAIDTQDREPRQINAEVQAWIESTMREISPAGPDPGSRRSES